MYNVTRRRKGSVGGPRKRGSGLNIGLSLTSLIYVIGKALITDSRGSLTL